MPEVNDEIPSALEERFLLVEDAAARSDFDAASWIAMVILGAAIPILLIIWGYHFAAGS
jgi:hypothetical protein